MIPQSTAMPPKDFHQLAGQQVAPDQLNQLQLNNMLTNYNDDSETINFGEFIKTILSSNETTQTQNRYHHVQYPPTSNSTMAVMQQQPPMVLQQHMMPQNTNSSMLSPSLQNLQETSDEMTFEEFLIRNGALELSAVDHHHHSHTLPSAVTPQTFTCNPSNNNQLVEGAVDMDIILLRKVAALLGVDPPQIGTSTSTAATAGAVLIDQHPIHAIQCVENGKEAAVEDRRGKKKKKRTTEDVPLEVMIEKRELRMIKNRLSASRSRYRKQVQALEIKAEVAQLRAENAMLKNQVVHLQQQNNELRQGKNQNPHGDVRMHKRGSSCPPSFM